MFTASLSQRLQAAGLPGHTIDIVMEDLLRRLLELEKLEQEKRLRHAQQIQNLQACLGDTMDAGSRERTAAVSALCYQPTAIHPAFGADIPRGANVGFVSGAAVSARANTEKLLDQANDLARRGDEAFIEKLGEANRANERGIKVGGAVKNFDTRVAGVVAAACASPGIDAAGERV